MIYKTLHRKQKIVHWISWLNSDLYPGRVRSSCWLLLTKLLIQGCQLIRHHFECFTVANMNCLTAKEYLYSNLHKQWSTKHYTGGKRSCTKNRGWTQTCTQEGLEVPAPLVTPVVLL
jgi:hypothetical protein